MAEKINIQKPRSVLNPTHWFSALSLGSTTQSDPYDIRPYDNIGIQLIWTGTPTGTITIEAQIDSSTWTDMGVSPAITLSGSASSQLVGIRNQAFNKIRVVYTRTSGTGSLDAYLIGKSL